MFNEPKQRVALSSVLAAIVLTFIKIVAGILTGSLGIIAEALHSALDLGAALMTYFAVRWANIPADVDHPFGHEKVESLSAFTEVGLLLITCGAILWEAFQRLFFKKVEIEFSWVAVAVMVISIVIDYSRSKALLHAAKKYNSQALEADALHFSSDILSSVVVILGLFCIKYGYPKADAYAAMVVALWVLVISIRLARQTMDVLLDRAPSLQEIKKITGIAESIPGVEDVHDVRVRQAGPKMFINMHIHIDRTMAFEQAHSVIDRVENKLQESYPDVDILIHQEPQAKENESVNDKIRMIANDLHVSVHDITVHNVGDKLRVNLDIEIDENVSFQKAHDLASQLENKILQNLSNIEEVTSHLEPLYHEIGRGKDITRKKESMIHKIEAAAKHLPNVLDCHQVNIRETENQLIATLHCTLDSSFPLSEVHTITSKIEQLVLQKNPDLDRVIVHAEPGEHQKV